MTPHKHAEIIKAWADGATIQYKSTVSDTWTDIPYIPEWRTDREYRVKPEPVTIRMWRFKTGNDRRWHESFMSAEEFDRRRKTKIKPPSIQDIEYAYFTKEVK